jgi:hypothetical protein
LNIFFFESSIHVRINLRINLNRMKKILNAFARMVHGVDPNARPPLRIPNLEQKELDRSALFAKFSKDQQAAERADDFSIYDGIFTVPSVVNRKHVDLVPEDLVKLYMLSPTLKREMNFISSVWVRLECDPTGMSYYFEHQGVPEEGRKIMGALKAWKQDPSTEPAVLFIEFILNSPDFHHLIKAYCGSVVSINKEAMLMPYLLATGYYGRVVALYPHGNPEGVDYDIIAVMDMKCLHPHPADQAALAALSPKQLDLVMCTMNDREVNWSTGGRLFTSFQLSLQGAVEALTYSELDDLQKLREIQIHQKMGRICDVSSLAKQLGQIPRKEAEAQAKAILEKTNLGGLSGGERTLVLLAMVNVLTVQFTPTPQEEPSEILRRQKSATEAVLQLLKQIAHILALQRREYKSDTGAVVEAAVSGCSEETKRTVYQLLRHEVPDDKDGIASVLAFLCEKIGSLPLPKPAPVAPDVPESPLEPKNPKVEAIVATLLAAKAVKGPDAELTAKETAFQEMQPLILRHAALRNLPLAQSKYDVAAQRAQKALTKTENAQKRKPPQRKEGESDTDFQRKVGIQQKELEDALKLYQLTQKELDEAAACLERAKTIHSKYI